MAARKRGTREVTYEEQTARSRLKRSRTKADLEAEILDYARRVGEQARELQRLRAEVSEANEQRDEYREIDRAVNLLARVRVKADQEKPKPESETTFFKFNREGGTADHERTRCTTHPQAMAAVLADLKETVEKLCLDGEEREMFEQELDGAEAEVECLLRALKMDAWEWERVKWKY